ncbi:DUF1016 N-terminal domain-containing protein [Asticcacaulis taihuensis]|uniref:DUF1016 N-terminal domain-containing protein n=1 Tax=Asticcacaulis taihuensis TaxID=260084 RepID=UPI003F7B82B6
MTEQIAAAYPGLREFAARKFYRMRQFYGAYAGQELVTPLGDKLPWTHHLIIMGQSHRPEER